MGGALRDGLSMGRRGRKSEAFRGWCVTGRAVYGAKRPKIRGFPSLTHPTHSVYGAKRPKIRGFPWVVRYGTGCLWGEEAENQRLPVGGALRDGLSMGRRGRKSEASRGWCVTGRAVYGAKRPKIRGFPSLTHPTHPTPDSRLPTPDSRLPTPDSLFPVPFTICH
ncbi:MAG: hypothetical protein F6K55_10325 [Moorea sp. SIO4A3]|nr:hypothetical protein [Moorena sp. SIO4A3]